MNGALRPVAGIDHGTPPVEVLQQQARLKDLLESDGVSVPAEAPPQSSDTAKASNGRLPTPDNVPGDQEDGQVIAPRKRPIAMQRVSLQLKQPGMPSFKLEFDVVEVCIKPYYISLWLASSLGFEPSSTMKFELRYKEKSYPVIFAGAEFEFQTVAIRGISFLRDKDLETQEQKT